MVFQLRARQEGATMQFVQHRLALPEVCEALPLYSGAARKGGGYVGIWNAV